MMIDGRERSWTIMRRSWTVGTVMGSYGWSCTMIDGHRRLERSWTVETVMSDHGRSGGRDGHATVTQEFQK